MRDLVNITFEIIRKVLPAYEKTQEKHNKNTDKLK